MIVCFIHFSEHRGLEVDKQIENLKELLQHDADAYSKYV
jgi:hypothetical protein